MKKTTKVVGSLIGASMMVAAGAGAAIAVPADQAATVDNEAVAEAAAGAEAAAKVANVEGSFAYTQDRVTDNATIAGAFLMATNALCDSTPSYGTAITAIAVGGDIAETFDANVEELCEKCGESHVMACSCAANVAGGGAIINAEVTGVSVASIAAVAGL